MARVATYLLASTKTPILDTNMYNVRQDIAVANAAANNGDNLPIMTFQRAGRLVGAKVNAQATLGAGCTLTLAVYRAGALVANVTATTTAGAASIVSGAALANLDFLAGDELVLVVGGANIGAAATVTVDVHLQH